MKIVKQVRFLYPVPLPGSGSPLETLQWTPKAGCSATLEGQVVAFRAGNEAVLVPISAVAWVAVEEQTQTPIPPPQEAKKRGRPPKSQG